MSFTSDEDQEDVIRRFFKENGKAILLGLVVGFGTLFGWKYWQGQRSDTAIRHASEYEQVIKGLNGSATAELAKIETFVQSSDNSYGVFAALQLAHKFIEDKQYDKAISQLQIASKHTSEVNLNSLIALRLARLQLQQKQYDAALSALSVIKDKESAWQVQAESLRGDILLITGDQAGAISAYKKGMDIKEASPSLKALLRVKLDNLVS